MPGPGPEFPERKKAEGPQPEAEAEAGGGRRGAGGGPSRRSGAGRALRGRFRAWSCPRPAFTFGAGSLLAVGPWAAPSSWLRLRGAGTHGRGEPPTPTPPARRRTLCPPGSGAWGPGSTVGGRPALQSPAPSPGFPRLPGPDSPRSQTQTGLGKPGASGPGRSPSLAGLGPSLGRPSKCPLAHSRVSDPLGGACAWSPEVLGPG